MSGHYLHCSRLVFLGLGLIPLKRPDHWPGPGRTCFEPFRAGGDISKTLNTSSIRHTC